MQAILKICHSEPRSGEESREQKCLLLPPAAADRNSQNDSFLLLVPDGCLSGFPELYSRQEK